jgi:hypothetical protein
MEEAKATHARALSSFASTHESELEELHLRVKAMVRKKDTQKEAGRKVRTRRLVVIMFVLSMFVSCVADFIFSACFRRLFFIQGGSSRRRTGNTESRPRGSPTQTIKRNKY